MICPTTWYRCSRRFHSSLFSNIYPVHRCRVGWSLSCHTMRDGVVEAGSPPLQTKLHSCVSSGKISLHQSPYITNLKFVVGSGWTSNTISLPTVKINPAAVNSQSDIMKRVISSMSSIPRCSFRLITYFVQLIFHIQINICLWVMALLHLCLHPLNAKRSAAEKLQHHNFHHLTCNFVLKYWVSNDTERHLEHVNHPALWLKSVFYLSASELKRRLTSITWQID